MDYSSFQTAVCRDRAARKAMGQQYDGINLDSGYVSMAYGKPAQEVFPLQSGTLKLSDGSELEVGEEEMAAALQYGQAPGDDELRSRAKEIIRLVHDPPTMRSDSHPGKMELVLCNGAQDCIYRVVENLLDDKSAVLVEEYAYPGFMSSAQPRGCHVVPLRCDKGGIIIEDLVDALAAWPKAGEDWVSPKGKLKVIYCIPSGGNPTGLRYTLERKRRIYQLAQEYNFIIIEDDAYYFLEQRPLLPSFLSMDVDGRVLRIDSYSKTIAPGLRIGSIAGPASLIYAIQQGLHVSSMGCSGISQMFLLALLRKMGTNGYLRHCENVAKFYDKRRASCLHLAEKYFSDLADWHAPTGGMFLWIQFRRISDTFELVMKKLLKRKVLVVAGAAFLADLDKSSPCIRISYTQVDPSAMERAFKIIKEEVKKIEESGAAN